MTAATKCPHCQGTGRTDEYLDSLDCGHCDAAEQRMRLERAMNIVRDDCGIRDLAWTAYQIGLASAVPQGWQVVPIEPTDAMAVAAVRATLDDPRSINGVAQYRSMIAAAPKVKP